MRVMARFISSAFISRVLMRSPGNGGQKKSPSGEILRRKLYILIQQLRSLCDPLTISLDCLKEVYVKIEYNYTEDQVKEIHGQAH